MKKLNLLCFTVFGFLILFYYPKTIFADCIVACAPVANPSSTCASISNSYCGPISADPSYCSGNPSYETVLCCDTVGECSQTCSEYLQACSAGLPCCNPSTYSCIGGFCQIFIPTNTPGASPPPVTVTGTSSIDWDYLYNTVFPNPGAFGRLSTSTTIGTIISALLNFIFPIAGLLLLLYFIYGGFLLMTSGGTPQRAQAARAMITTALTGFAIIFAAYWIVQAVGIMLGLGQVGNIF